MILKPRMIQIPQPISKWDYENHKNRHGETQNRKKAECAALASIAAQI